MMDMDQKIAKYEIFINDVLREDLKKIDLRLQKLNAEITDMIQQKQCLKVVTDETIHPDGFKTQVNLGCNFFMEASVVDTTKLLLNIGLNHYLEFTIPDAYKYLDLRIKAYESKAEELRIQSRATKAHIKLMLMGVGQLQDEKVGVTGNLPPGGEKKR